ncbi:hypothetical protein COCVIDRAFT_110607, partial [Bipolaris victoriae FI3]
TLWGPLAEHSLEGRCLAISQKVGFVMASQDLSDRTISPLPQVCFWVLCSSYTVLIAR